MKYLAFLSFVPAGIFGYRRVVGSDRWQHGMKRLRDIRQRDHFAEQIEDALRGNRK